MHVGRTTEFRSWRNNPIGSHGHDEASFAAGSRGDELIKSDVPHGAEHSCDIPMRQASVNLHRASLTDERASADEPIFDDGERSALSI